MRFEQIKYFMEVATSGSITSAAQQLFISQQALSDAIKKLERELNLTLFIRSKTGVELTEDGKLFAHHANRILSQYQQLELDLASRFSATEQTISGHLTIYASPLFALTLLPDALIQMEASYPNVHICCIEANVLENIASADQTEPSLCLLTLDDLNLENFFSTLPSHLTYQVLAADALIACVSSGSPLSLKKHVTYDEFKQEKRVTFNYISQFFPNSTFASRGLNFNGNVCAYSDNIALHEKLIVKNIAISSVPKLFYKRVFKSPLITFLPIHPEVTLHHLLILPKNHSSDAVTAFTTVLFEQLNLSTPPI